MKENKKKALYSKELIEKLKKNVCLEEVVKNDFELKKVGEYYYMHCPFCNGGRILSISKKKAIWIL